MRGKSRQQGALAEEIAKTYLMQRGLSWIASNFTCRWGEIDLIMQENDMIVFVEVRSRTSCFYGNALESIDKKKQDKLIKTAQYYQKIHETRQAYAKASAVERGYRFDVVTLQGVPPQVDWIPHVISCAGV